VSVSAIRRYEKTGRVPAPVLRLAVAHATGIPLVSSRAWAGWRFAREALVSPEGIGWTPALLNAWHFERQLLQEYRRQLAQPRQLALL
jgi:hypothetical protein